METELHKGEVFACRDGTCRIEVEVSKGGLCRDLSCCGRTMIRKTSEEEYLDRCESDSMGECDTRDC
ncbi:MAG: hypothetical protein ACYTGB_08705 [Planctomycetota bacterium]|jgi:hypothetical protein